MKNGGGIWWWRGLEGDIIVSKIWWCSVHKEGGKPYHDGVPGRLLKPVMAAVVKMAIQTLVELLAEVTVEMRLKMAVKAMEMRILMLRRLVFWLPLMSTTIGPYP